MLKICGKVNSLKKCHLLKASTGTVFVVKKNQKRMHSQTQVYAVSNWICWKIGFMRQFSWEWTPEDVLSVWKFFCYAVCFLPHPHISTLYKYIYSHRFNITKKLLKIWIWPDLVEEKPSIWFKLTFIHKNTYTIPYMCIS